MMRRPPRRTASPPAARRRRWQRIVSEMANGTVSTGSTGFRGYNPWIPEWREKVWHATGMQETKRSPSGGGWQRTSIIPVNVLGIRGGARCEFAGVSA